VLNKKRLVVLAVIAIAAFFAWQDVDSALSQARPWMNPVITQNEYAALDWVRANTRERAVFASGIFGGETLMGNTLREGTVGGDWAIIPEVVKRMHAIQYDFYGASAPKQAHATAVEYGAEFVWAPDRNVFAGYEWVEVNHSLFIEPYFTKVFDNGAIVYEVNS